MVRLEIENLSKVFPDGTVGLDALSLSAEAGEMLVLLGPSGCGKSTLLRCLAGLERPSAGSIRLGEEMVFDTARKIDWEPEKRDVGMVFQNYALWPHMTVLQNVQFPLRARRMKKALQNRSAEEMLELVSCSALADRYPGQLSGGQQQRIGLARALVSRPDLILFDEPLSNLDARLRADLRSAIRELHGRLGFTGVYVTHDQEEGLSVSDRIAVMNVGQFVSVGTPAEVHAAPPNDWAADFLGMTNRVTAWWFDGRVHLGQLDRPEGEVVALQARFRPQDVKIADQSAGDGHMVIRGATVRDRAFSGSHVEYVADVGSDLVRIVTLLDDDHEAHEQLVGNQVGLQIRHDRVKLFTPDGRLFHADPRREPAGLV